jgi:hypothetical protein
VSGSAGGASVRPARWRSRLELTVANSSAFG